MKYNILITDNLSTVALEQLESAQDAGYELIPRPGADKLKEIISAYDALIIRSSVQVDADLLEHSNRLKVIGRAGVGLDNVDIDAASMRGVIVMNTPGANTIATAEHAMAMLLAVARRIPQADASIRAREWKRSRFIGVQLYRKTLGIVGLGRVGGQVARRAQAFGMEILAYDPYISDEVARELKVKLVDLDELLARSDFVSLHVALTPETEGMFTAETIGQMKAGVRLVNCARGALLDETALTEALQSGHVAAAALDVYATEPLPADSPLRGMANVVLTPHIAASTVEAQRDVGTQIVDQVLAALRNEDFRNAVNMPVADVNVFQKLRPYLQLAERLGSLQMQLAEGRIKWVEVEFQGREVADHIKPLAVALLKGLLDPVVDRPVNYISAPHLALERGINVTETRGLAKLKYANLLSCRVAWDGGSRQVTGSLLGQELPRIVQLNGFHLDARLEGIILIMESLDVPGVVGQVGSLLGSHDINIAEWRMGRTAREDNRANSLNLSFINLDSPASPEIIAELAQLENVFYVNQITL